MNLWELYKDRVNSNCASKPGKIKDIEYWRNNLFAGIVIYLLPLCFVALVPSLYFVAFVSRNHFIIFLDLITLISLISIAFIPKITISFRKIIFITISYIFSCFLLFYIGPSGGALIYFHAISVLFILIFDSKYAYHSVFINIFISIIFGFALHWEYLPWVNESNFTVGKWIAVSSNLIFLSLIEAKLIPRIFVGLQQTINNETQLQKKSRRQQKLLKKNLEALEQKNNELEQFAYIASHDLQEPLRMVTSFLSKIKDKYENVLDDKGKKYIYFAVDGAERMRDIILDLLEYTKVGNSQEEIEKVDINEIINDNLVVLSNQIKDTKAKINFQNLPIIYSFYAPLNQVFQNLISNAIKYKKNNVSPEIHISCKEFPNFWQFSVQDNGIGIKNEYHEKVFVIFQRLHNNDIYSGTGIGLAIVKKIIDNLEGKIWIKSEIDKGSTFYFTIPKVKIKSKQ